MRVKWGYHKHIHEGEIYCSTNKKYIQIIEVTDTHFTYFILQGKLKKGRPYSHLTGNYHTVCRSCISNYYKVDDYKVIVKEGPHDERP